MKAVRSQTWSEGDAADRRRHRRYPVSLITRVGEARDATEVAVVTSLSAGGAFVQGEQLPSAGARLCLDLGLGGGLGRVETRARVVRINRREGAEVVFGFGVEFDEPPADLADRLEALHAQNREQVRLDALGYVDWPVYPGADPSEVPAGANGLQVWSAAGWIDLAVAPVHKNGAVPDAQGAATLIRLALGGLANLDTGKRLVLSYRSRMLGPALGVPSDEVMAELRPGARGHVWTRAFEAQLRLIDLLESMNWRLERLSNDHREPLASIRRSLDDARRAVSARRASLPGEDHGDSRVTVVVALDRGLAALDALIGGMLRCLEASKSPDIEWKPAPVAPPPPPIRLPNAGRWLRGADAAIRMWSPQRRAALLTLVIVIASSVGYAFYAPSTVTIVNARDILPLDTVALKRALPVESLIVDGRKVVIQVPASWTETPVEARRGAFISACTSLGMLRYTEAVVVTSGKHEVARWHGGRIEIL